MISQKQQELINILHIKNAQSTKDAHAGHNIIVNRWDEFHVVNVCKQCGCTVGNIVKNMSNERQPDVNDIFSRNYAQDHKYTFFGRN